MKVAVAAIKAAFDAEKDNPSDGKGLAEAAQRAAQEVLAAAESLNVEKRATDARIGRVYRGEEEVSEKRAEEEE